MGQFNLALDLDELMLLEVILEDVIQTSIEEDLDCECECNLLRRIYRISLSDELSRLKI